MEKARYSSTAFARKLEALHNAVLSLQIWHGHERKETFSHNWAKVDVNDFIAKWVPNAEITTPNAKVYFTDKTTGWIVVADVGGGYCRLARQSSKTGRLVYYDINGKSVKWKKIASGERVHRSKAEQYELTHFYILRRKEMSR